MPVQDDGCPSCHVQKGDKHPGGKGKSFELIAAGAKLCEQCHEPFGTKKVVHMPVKDGDCLACHNPHGADGKFLLKNSDDLTALCLNCHDEKPFKQKQMHGPTAVGSCTSCHNPHEANNKYLLKSEERNLCLSCHDDMAKAIKEAPVGHPPVADSACTSCHDPHGAPAPHVLKKQVPDLCIDCHDDIAKKMSAKVPHKPLQQEGSCISCHLAHTAKEKGLLPKVQKDICIGCHSSDNLGKPALRNIQKELEGKSKSHGPIASGRCSGCHDPHGSDYARILTKEYPRTFYAPYKEGIYDFCLSCHNKDMLRFTETTIYTKFRNGKRNLHYVHVANSRKGRTCRTCHEPHAGDGEKLISTEGPAFGSWRIPLRFKSTPTGGSCAPGCHRNVAYDREKPVTYN
jgi:predicted CXXCH cytochrome family protein